MGKFAKLIELDNNEQVLLTVDYNDENDNYDVVIRTDLDGITPSIKLGFETEEKALSVMENYTAETALKFRHEMLSMLS
jgi:hypothetical protein